VAGSVRRARSPFFVLCLSAIINLAALGSGCGGAAPPREHTEEDAGNGPGDGIFHDGLAVGAVCTADAECSGYGTPTCIAGLYPLATLTADPGLQAIGLPLPGGYCSAAPSCASDAQCGTGGKCFQPLADVTDETLDTIASTLPDVDVHQFAQYGACLDPCVDNTECREGYVCATPIASLLGLVPGARLETFCVGHDDESGCGTCGAHASCNAAAMPPRCDCDSGFVANGNTCEASVVVDGCASNPCAHGSCTAGTGSAYTCACITGYQGANCDAIVDCGVLAAPTHGGVSAPNGTTYSHSAAYGCSLGYTLVGTQTRACGADGQWSGAAPTCAPVDCGSLANPANGTVATPSGSAVDATATYSCSSGYVPSGGTSRTCQANGSWSGAAPTCVDDPCLPNPCSNGGTCAGASGGGTYTCGCAAGYTGATCQFPLFACIPDPCNAHGTCSGAGTCSCSAGYSGGTCTVAADCGALSAPSNGTVTTAAGTTVGKTATYACSAGHTASGSTTRTCNTNGTWSGTAPTCLPSDCGALASPTNGVASTPTGTSYGQTGSYSCDLGYSVSGSATRTCQADGTWSGTAPTCGTLDCGALASPTHGSVATPNGTAFGQTATYACDSGYELAGNASRTCGSDGSWAGVAPTCAEASTCTLVYRFADPSPTGSRFRIQPSSGATTVNVGPGSMIVRVPRDASNHPVAGSVELLYFDIDQYFGPVSGVTTETRVCLLTPGTVAPAVSSNSSPPEQSAQAGCIAPTNTTTMATGTFAISAPGAGSFSFGCYSPNPTSANYTPAQATGTAPGCMQTWFSYGRIKCASGELCAIAVSPQDQWLDRTAAWSQHFLAPMSLSSNFATMTMGDPNGAATTSAWAHVPNTDNGWTGFALVGALDVAASTCVP
jgi:hypothetical protein